MDAFLYIQINAYLFFFYFPNIQGLYAKEGTRPHMFITRQSGHYKVHILYYNIVSFFLSQAKEARGVAASYTYTVPKLKVLKKVKNPKTKKKIKKLNILVKLNKDQKEYFC